MWTYARWHADTALHEHIMRHGMFARACYLPRRHLGSRLIQLSILWVYRLNPVEIKTSQLQSEAVEYTSFNHGSGAWKRFLGVSSQQARGACFGERDERFTGFTDCA